jgi:hypothetical protein
MTSAIADVTADTLHAFADAWNRHDVDAIMSFMTDDCVFESSAGPDVCGSRYAGREAVAAGFAEVWSVFPDAHWGNARHFVHRDREFPSGSSPEREPTVVASKYTAVISLLFATARSH